jgi:TolA-binding protein
MVSLEEATFQTEVQPLLEGVKEGHLHAALSSLSKTHQAITEEIILLCDQTRAPRPQDDALKETDIASIRSALSRGDLEEAEGRAKMALLSFPTSSEVQDLDSEVAGEIRKETQIKQALEDAEKHLAEQNWKAAIRLFNSVLQLDPARDSIRGRIGKAFLSWADELRHRDLRAALKLAETAATFAPDNSMVRKLRAQITEDYRAYAVAKAMNLAKEHEAKGEYPEAEKAIRAAMEELPDQLTLVLYLKELDKTKRSRQYEQELRALQNNVLDLTSHRKYAEAETALREFLEKYSESATALTLLEGVQRDNRLYQNAQIADRALLDIAPLAEGNLKALKQAIDLANGALRKIGTDTRLAKAIQDLEARRSESRRNLANFLERAEEEIRVARFKSVSASLQGAAAIDPENPRITELRGKLKRARTETRLNAIHSQVAGIRRSQKALVIIFRNQLLTARTSLTQPIDTAFKPGFARVRSAFTALLNGISTTAKAFVRMMSEAGRRRRLITLAAVLASITILTGIANYLYFRSQPQIVQLSIDSVPRGARVVIDGTATGTTPYSASWELRRGETREVVMRLELENYEPVEEVVRVSTDQLHPTPLHRRLKFANTEVVIARLYELAQVALKVGKLGHPEDGSVAAYLNQMKEIDPDEHYLPAERADLRREAIRIYKDGLAHLPQPERDGDGELTRLQLFVRVFDADDPVINARIKDLETLKSRQKQEIERSLTLGILLPPTPRNALDALRNFTTRFPSQSDWSDERREEARRQLLSTARKKCESRLPDCDQFVISALEFFPGDTELQNSAKLFGTGDSSPLSTEVQTLVAKMEGALQGRRYVYPLQSSAAYFAGEILRTTPAYSRASIVKKLAREETDKVVDQLTRSGQETRALRSLEDARVVLADFRRAQNLIDATLQFWPDDAKAGRQITALRARIADVDRLSQEHEFPVVHDHVYGDCRGLLSVSAFRVKYVIRGSGNDGFDRPLEDIRFPIEVRGGALELTIDSKTMKFKVEVMASTMGSVTVIRGRMNEMREARSRIETKQLPTTSGER